MRRIIAALCWLYVIGAGVMIRAAMLSHDHGSSGWTAAYTSAAILFGLAIFHHAYHRDELRAALVRLERAARPAPVIPGPAHEDTVQITLAAACCDTWWATAGTDHDPDHCTRKGHHA